MELNIPDFSLEKVFDEKTQEIKNRKLIRNLKTNDQIEIVSDKYVLVQPKKLIEDFEKASKFKINYANFFKGKVYAELSENTNHIALLNSVDGKTSVWIIPYVMNNNIKIYGIRRMTQLHRGNVDAVIKMLLKDIKKVNEQFAIFVAGLSQTVSDPEKKKFLELMPLKLNEKEEEHLKKAKTYMDVYKVMYERVARRNIHDVKKAIRTIKLVEKIIWEGLSIKITQ